jgi:transcriptional regulator with XRE-family HTH domain
MIGARLNRAMGGRSRIDIDSQRLAERLRADFGRELGNLLVDAGAPAAAVAARAGISPSTLSRITNGTREPSFRTLARLALAIGGTPVVRVTPGSGVPVRDRWSAPMIEAFIRGLGPDWTAHPEVPVFVPARGSVDVVLRHAQVPLLVATEFQSGLRRLEQVLRWSAEKAAGLRHTDLARGIDAVQVSRLLVVRSTPATRDVAATFGSTLRAAYPADPEAAAASLRGDAPWPGAALLWMRFEERGRVSLLSRATGRR